MVEQDTIRLLRECDAGVKMGTSSIEDVLDYVKSESLKKFLIKNKDEHYKLDTEIQMLLAKYKDAGKDPNPIADLMTDGCNMGVKSLNKYLNEYEAADEKSKEVAKKLIRLEEDLAKDIRKYL